jgi:hypothetical protein
MNIEDAPLLPNPYYDGLSMAGDGKKAVGLIYASK